MPEIEAILILLVAVAMLATLANRIGIPYPILLVLGGLALGFVPALPRVELDPEVVFLLFLPPLLYVSAIFTSWRDFRANLRPISLLAVGLVLMTTFVVAVVTGAFSLWEAGLQFMIGAAGGIVVGLAVGWFVIWTRRHVSEEPNVQNTISLLTPFVAYLLAEEPSQWAWEQLGLPGAFAFSGVLSVVAVGLYLGRRGPYVISPATRLQGYAFWELVTFLLNGFIFGLIGLQLGGIVEGLSE